MSSRTPRLSTIALPLVAALALVAVSGCGGTVVDPFKTEVAVLAEVQIKTDTKIASVDCPSEVEVVPGREFSCTVTAEDGAEARADLRILNDDADLDILRLSKP